MILKRARFEDCQMAVKSPTAVFQQGSMTFNNLNGLSSEGKTAGKGSRMKSFSDQIKDQSIECRSKQPGIDRQSQAGWGRLNIKW